MDKESLKRFLEGRTSLVETDSLLRYLNTAEGKKVLSEVLGDIPEELFFREQRAIDAATSQRIYQHIRESITVPDRTRVHFIFQGNFWRIAASVLIVLSAILILYHFNETLLNSLYPVNYVEYTSPKGRHTKITFVDGTTVNLKSGAMIRYPENFLRTAERRVTLYGEAYFDVRRDENRPFVIHTHKGEIRVLGTSFNVKESALDSNVVVAVTEGLVSVGRVGKSNDVSLSLKKGDVGLLTDNKVERLAGSQSDNFLSWSTGRLSFTEMSLGHVVHELSIIYDTDIRLADPSLESLKLTAKLRYQPLKVVLAEIAVFMNLQYTTLNGVHVLDK